MTRCGFATGRQVWPGAELRMQCEPIGMREYIARDPDADRMLRSLVGDLHRIMVYPSLGFQIDQPVPVPLKAAPRTLAAAGYGARMLTGLPI